MGLLRFAGSCVEFGLHEVRHFCLFGTLLSHVLSAWHTVGMHKMLWIGERNDGCKLRRRPIMLKLYLKFVMEMEKEPTGVLYASITVMMELTIAPLSLLFRRVEIFLLIT